MKDSEVEIRGPNADVEGNVAMDDSGREGYKSIHPHFLVHNL
jgi:hypothetical protein